jgi:hypothetical protein
MSGERCEPCSFLGVTSPAVDVAGWDFTPVCEWHTTQHFTDRPPTDISSSTPEADHER